MDDPKFTERLNGLILAMRQNSKPEVQAMADILEDLDKKFTPAKSSTMASGILGALVWAATDKKDPKRWPLFSISIEAAADFMKTADDETNEGAMLQ